MQTKAPIEPPPVRSKAGLVLSSISLAFMAIGAFSALLVLTSRPILTIGLGFPNTASTTICFVVATVVAHTRSVPGYRWGIVLGLAFSALGDLFLMLPRERFVAGLASFLIAQICYLRALTSDTPLAARRAPFLVAGAVGLVLLTFMWPGVPTTLRFPVVLYTVALLSMAAQANARALVVRNLAATMAAVGAILFVASDAGLAIHRFGHPFPYRHWIVLGTYFAAQAGVALSVVVCPSPCCKEGG